ncbi:MAG: OmpH family outer membrane protein [Acidobacteriota bacterium]|nr:OmpH family outer membrane protein [Acidobacteriota bacterium]
MSVRSRVSLTSLALFLISGLVGGVAAVYAEEAAPVDAAQLVVQPQGRVGVIDIGRLMEASETGRAALSSLEVMQAEKKARFDALTAEGAALEAQLKEGELTLAEEKMSALRQEIEDKKVEISRFGTDSQRELEQAQRSTFSEIQQRVFPIINEVGREGAFALIFRKFESGLIFADEEIDITDQVIARLDGATQSGG